MDRTNVFINSEMINEKAKAIFNYLNLNPHRFDVNGHFDPRSERDHLPSNAGSSNKQSSANDLYQGVVLAGQAKPKNPPIHPKTMDREILTEELAHRKAEREGYKYDFEKCDQLRASEMRRCYRRWKENPLLRLVVPHAHEECLQRARERFGHCKDHHKMPADNPEYGTMDASRGGTIDLDRRKPKPVPESNNGSENQDDKPSEFSIPPSLAPGAIAAGYLFAPLLMPRPKFPNEWLKHIVLPQSPSPYGMPLGAAPYAPPPWLLPALGVP